MKNDTAVVFIHSGYSWYLPYALNQARVFRKDSQVHLIGKGYVADNIRHQPIETLESKMSKGFRDAYQHMSTCSESFELFCWLRWFYLLEYMSQNGLASVLYLDSDVLLFSTIEEIQKAFCGTMLDCAFWVPQVTPPSFDWGIGSGHTSYWTADSLRSFCEFAFETFRNPRFLDDYRRWWKYHQVHGKPGGVCDMVTFGLYWREHPGSITNLALPQSDTMFDHKISSAMNFGAEEYRMHNGTKIVVPIDGVPHVVRDGRPLVLHKSSTLHFQGNNKFLMPLYYSGGSFRGKGQSDAIRLWKLARHRLASSSYAQSMFRLRKEMRRKRNEKGEIHD